MAPTNQDGLFSIKLGYYLGILADGLWAVGLFRPSLFAFLTNSAVSSEDVQALYMAGVLMTGWTILLTWAVEKPVERSFVALLTAMVAFSYLCMSLYNVVFLGNQFQVWIVIKTLVLVVTLIRSYLLAGRNERVKVA